jgi:hypothetical protein
VDKLSRQRVQVYDAVDAIVVFLERDELSDSAEIITEMEIAGGLNAGEYQRLELSHFCPQQAGGGPDHLIASVRAYARRAGRNQARTSADAGGSATYRLDQVPEIAIEILEYGDYAIWLLPRRLSEEDASTQEARMVAGEIVRSQKEANTTSGLVADRRSLRIV